MKIPTIIIDIDEVLADTMAAINAYHNRVYSTQFSAHDYASYRFWETWGCTQEECLARIVDFLDSPEWTDIQPFPAAQDAIQKLSGQARLIALTSRRSHLKERTQDWLNRHFGAGTFEALYFSNNNHHPLNGHLQSKGDIAQNLQADLVIEDSIDYARDIAAQNISVLLLDHPWNQSDDLPSLITRVRDWTEILAILRSQFPHLML